MSASSENEPSSPVAASEPVADELVDAETEKQDDDPLAAEDDAVELSDNESILSEVDEAQFENFDPENVEIEDRPALAIDEENLRLIGRHKRKRAEDGEHMERPRRHKEGRREKKSRRMRELEGTADGEDTSRRKERKKKDLTPENEEALDPATRECFSCFIFFINFVILDDCVT